MTREESADVLKFGAQYYESYKEEKVERADKALTDLEAVRFYDDLDEPVTDADMEDLLNDMLGPVRYEE